MTTLYILYQFFFWFTLIVIGFFYYFIIRGTAVTIFSMEVADQKDGILRLRPARNDRALPDKKSDKKYLKLLRTKKVIPQFIKGRVPIKLPLGIIRERMFIATPDWENFYPLDFTLLGESGKLGVYPELWGAIQFNVTYNLKVAKRELKNQVIMQIAILGMAVVCIFATGMFIKMSLGAWNEAAAKGIEMFSLFSSGIDKASQAAVIP